MIINKYKKMIKFFILNQYQIRIIKYSYKLLLLTYNNLIKGNGVNLLRFLEIDFDF